MPALLLASRTGFAAAVPSEGAFSPSSVGDFARMLAGKPYEAPDEKLPGGLKDLDYDQYRSIRFLPERALWRGKNLPFEAQFFHRGFFYKNRVNRQPRQRSKRTDLI
ncbi:glucan biosynthesis protein [Bradyrhizobium sp. 35]|uniref:glucan biosynthesis protein n=1 Tax=Bradyrhizobium sp. 35 TaxID=2782670 RepID=UPI001FFA2FBF|nr:glucan biosynthesis protein [Bradyrhizobium sp. 35]